MSETKKTNLIRMVINIIIVILVGTVGVNYLVKRSTGKISENEFNDMLDKGFTELNKTLPKELVPNVTLDNVRRDRKYIYQTYTIKNLSSNSINLDGIKQGEVNTLPRFCNLDAQKKTISMGYSYVFVYNTSDKNDVFRMVADKNTCNKYW